MKISDHVYAKKMSFTAVTPTGVMERTVFVYFVAGNDTSCLIDTGVYPSLDSVLDFVLDAGKNLKKIQEILITHSHTDHIGALKSLKLKLGCNAAASELSSRWIEDIDLQFKERPVPHFYDFVEGSVKIDRKLNAGDIIKLGGSTLKVYNTPGHEIGQMSFFHEEDGILFSADCIPVPGDIPIYDDVVAEIDSINRLKEIENVQILLMSWNDPYYGAEKVRKAFADALEYIKEVHNLTLSGIKQFEEDDIDRISKYVHKALALPANTYTKLFINTVQAHIREKYISL